MHKDAFVMNEYSLNIFYRKMNKKKSLAALFLLGKSENNFHGFPVIERLVDFQNLDFSIDLVLKEQVKFPQAHGFRVGDTSEQVDVMDGDRGHFVFSFLLGFLPLHIVL